MTLFATAIATVAYLAASHEDPSKPFNLFGMDLLLPEFFRNAAHGRNTVGAKPMGLAFGTIAFGIFLFASALGIRKKKRLWPICSVQIWLKAHIWLTTLTIPLVLFHCGFKTGGPHTTTLFWLYLIVMLSGYWGIALQQFMPRLMKENLPSEVVFEQIPNIRSKIYEDALTFRGQMAKEIATAQAKAMASPCIYCRRLWGSSQSGPPCNISKMGFFLRPGPTKPPKRIIRCRSASYSTSRSASRLWNP
jgi:hypothetical protein